MGNWRCWLLGALIACAWCAQAATPEPLLQAYARDAIPLDGTWKAIVDPYENGYYDYRYQPFDQRAEPPAGAYFTDSKMRDPGDLVEYDFDRAMSLQVPGDWNTQDPRLYYY